MVVIPIFYNISNSPTVNNLLFILKILREFSIITSVSITSRNYIEGINMKYKVTPNNRSREMREDDFIVSKTDLKGRITYANRIFMEFSQYNEDQLLNVQHNVVRHPDMPRAIFKLLWDTITAGKEIFAYVKNLSGDGSYYWVFANISPVVDENGATIGYCSVRRKPKQKALDVIIPLYREMVAEEKRNQPKDQIEASTKILNNFLLKEGKSYEEFILSL